MKQNIRLILLKKIGFLMMFLVAIGLPYISNASSYRVTSISEYQVAEKAAQAGDTIKWAPGTYEDVSWVILKDGIIVIASELGKTVFTGSSKVELQASHIVFSGFQFAGGKSMEMYAKLQEVIICWNILIFRHITPNTI
ncbi:MAG: hypothetical protein HC830_02485 [Bacteroidetes bacterium]|nr:hypothetical protein [Bacteroidota bacterium]